MQTTDYTIAKVYPLQGAVYVETNNGTGCTFPVHMAPAIGDTIAADGQMQPRALRGRAVYFRRGAVRGWLDEEQDAARQRTAGHWARIRAAAAKRNR